QNPRSQTMTMLLLIVTVFMGWQIFNQRGNQDPRTADELYTQFKKACDERRDVDATGLYPAYVQRLQQDRGPKGWTQDQVDEKEQEALVLMAQVKSRAAMAFVPFPEKDAVVRHKLSDEGYTRFLQPRYDKFHDTPLWTKKFDVTPDG